MGPFPPSWGNTYILLVVDYVSKWVEAIATQKNDAKAVMQFVHKTSSLVLALLVAKSVMEEVISAT